MERTFFPSIRPTRVVSAILIGAVLWGSSGPAALAQQTRTLEIRNGTVYVDGTQLSEEQLPDDLDLSGLSAQYRFVGVQRPVVELRGRLFAIGDSLEPVPVDQTDGSAEGVRTAAVPGRPSSAPEREQSAREQYLNEVQQSSRELYQRLQRERRLEQQAQGLARTIRTMPEGNERQRRVDSLRSMLDTLFEVKQENHRREIEQLQRKIQELQRRLKKREEMRASMIEHRLEQLIGTASSR